MDELIKTHHIRMSVERADSNPNMADSKDMDHWKCTLRVGKRSLTVRFSQGFGHNGKEPKIADVLDCLASDASGYENSNGFEDWCLEYGYDTDSRKAEKTYRLIRIQAEALSRIFDATGYRELLNAERL